MVFIVTYGYHHEKARGHWLPEECIDVQQEAHLHLNISRALWSLLYYVIYPMNYGPVLLYYMIQHMNYEHNDRLVCTTGCFIIQQKTMRGILWYLT